MFGITVPWDGGGDESYVSSAPVIPSFSMSAEGINMLISYLCLFIIHSTEFLSKFIYFDLVGLVIQSLELEIAGSNLLSRLF